MMLNVFTCGHNLQISSLRSDLEKHCPNIHQFHDRVHVGAGQLLKLATALSTLCSPNCLLLTVGTHESHMAKSLEDNEGENATSS